MSALRDALIPDEWQVAKNSLLRVLREIIISPISFITLFYIIANSVIINNQIVTTMIGIGISSSLVVVSFFLSKYFEEFTVIHEEIVGRNDKPEVAIANLDRHIKLSRAILRSGIFTLLLLPMLVANHVKDIQGFNLADLVPYVDTSSIIIKSISLSLLVLLWLNLGAMLLFITKDYYRRSRKARKNIQSEHEEDPIARLFSGVAFQHGMDILARLNDGKNLQEISEDLDLNRTEMQMYTNRMVRAELIYRSEDGRYRLTPLGSHLVNRMGDIDIYLEAVEVLENEEERVRTQLVEGNLQTTISERETAIHTKKWERAKDEIETLFRG